MKNKFQNKTVWITGASSGIGEQLAYDLSEQGANIILSARRVQELERVKINCKGRQDAIMVLPLDLLDVDNISQKVKKVLSVFGKIDVLINNGGISQRSEALETDLSVDKRIMNINYFGTIALTKAVLPSMVQHKLGHIVVISSVAGKLGAPKRTAYAASKHALQGFFDALRAEIWKHDITVTTICPGYTKTKIAHNALLGSGDPNQKIDTSIEKGMSVNYVSSRILNAILKKREEVYIGKKEILGIYIKRLWPKLFFKIARNLED